MKLIIVSGLSGSGKSIALHTLEDIGYYCIDNLPLALLETFATRLAASGLPAYQFMAVGIDARSQPDEMLEFPAIVERLQAYGIESHIIFLQADDDVLMKRFSETRRRHPLTSETVGLHEALTLERELLEPVANSADLYIDTSHTNVHELREQIHNRLGSGNSDELILTFESFGYKNGVPNDVDFVFDARCLPNPHWEPQLQKLTGQDRPVIDYLESHPLVIELFEETRDFLSRWIPRFVQDNRSYLTVAIGCTGGQHRSVYLAERLSAHFREQHDKVLTVHRDLK